MRLLAIVLFCWYSRAAASTIQTSTACALYFDSTLVQHSATDCIGSRFDHGETRLGTAAVTVVDQPNLAQMTASYVDYRFAPIGVTAGVTWHEDFDVVLTGSGGLAIFEPCLSVNTLTTGLLAAAVATIGGIGSSVSRVGSAGESGNCGAFPNHPHFLPFDTPFRMHVMLTAEAGSLNGGAPSGLASAAFLYSFKGWSLTGSAIAPIDNLAWTITAVEIPEPSLAIPSALALLALIGLRHRLY